MLGAYPIIAHFADNVELFMRTYIAGKILQPLNTGEVQAESSMSVLQFIDDYYLPHVQKELRPSTYKDYNDILRVHLRSRLGDIRLRDFRTVHGRRLLREITGVGHTSLLRIKSFLSGVFKHAKREGRATLKGEGVNIVFGWPFPCV